MNILFRFARQIGEDLRASEARVLQEPLNAADDEIGDRIRVRNELPEPTSVHWHGMILPNAMDGAGYVTQAPIPPGGDYTYGFDVRQAGTYFYHTHTHLDRQQSLGLYGALIIAPRQAPADLRADHDYVLELQEWLQRKG